VHENCPELVHECRSDARPYLRDGLSALARFTLAGRCAFLHQSHSVDRCFDQSSNPSTYDARSSFAE
jgi:hypothetical protein